MTNEQLVARIQAGENVGNNMAILYDQVKDFIHAMAYKSHGQGRTGRSGTGGIFSAV